MNKRPREDDKARGAARARGSVAPSGTVVKELLEGARGGTERQERDRARGSGTKRGLLRVKDEQEDQERQERDRARGGTKRGLLRVKDEQEDPSPMEHSGKRLLDRRKEENEEESPMDDAESEEGFDVYECEIVTKKVTKKRTRPAEWQPYPFHSFIIFR